MPAARASVPDACPSKVEGGSPEEMRRITSVEGVPNRRETMSARNRAPETQRAPEAVGCGRADVTLHLMPCAVCEKDASGI